MATWEKIGTPHARTFRQNLDADPEVAGRIAPAALDAAMDARAHLRHLDAVFLRVFGEEGPSL
jgi:adenylosuccinate lyase